MLSLSHQPCPLDNLQIHGLSRAKLPLPLLYHHKRKRVNPFALVYKQLFNLFKVRFKSFGYKASLVAAPQGWSY